MLIKIITVGKTRKQPWQSAEQEFIKRIRHYSRLKEETVKDASFTSLRNADLVQKREAENILATVSSRDFLIVLDKSGDQRSSRKFADLIQKKMDGGVKNLTFVIGGPFGLSDEVLHKANVVLSLSKMTFLHEMAKVLLLEQIYRAFTILNGEKYHK